jgi:hypothetical protein
MKEEIDQVLPTVRCGLMKLKELNKEKLTNRKSIIMLGIVMVMDVAEIIFRINF